VDRHSKSICDHGSFQNPEGRPSLPAQVNSTSDDVRTSRAGGYERARPDVQALVPRSARRILDLGCSSGLLGAALKKRQGAEVVGIELDAGYAREAEDRLDRVFRLDLDELPGRSNLDLGEFDCIVATGVLEHLRDPWEVFRHAVGLLGPTGSAVISLPIVRHWTVLRTLLGGSWPRRDAGIFDRTHLRWFTLPDAKDLVTDAGLRWSRCIRSTGSRTP
jgi:2-polyprenyl-3-methyl-5-hydroxy-6-metoxy-1,4-benzoquinol methylase